MPYGAVQCPTIIIVLSSQGSSRETTTSCLSSPELLRPIAI